MVSCTQRRWCCGRAGQRLAIDHHARVVTSRFEDFYESNAHLTHTLYKTTALATSMLPPEVLRLRW